MTNIVMISAAMAGAMPVMLTVAYCIARWMTEHPHEIG